MKRLISLMAVLFFCLTIAVPTVSAKKKPFKIRFSHVVSENTPKGWGAEEFARRVNEELKGEVEVKVFPNSQLYDDNQAVEALSAGFIEMAAPSSAKFVGSIPALQLFDMPFLFKDLKAVHKTVDGEIGDELKKMFEERGLGIKLMTFWDNAFKQFSDNVRPLIKPEDFKGVKFRIMSSDILEAQMNALGGVGLKLPFSEVYNALEQGVCDGQENTASNIYTKKFHEVQKYMTFTNHGYLGYAVIMNQKFWDKMPKNLQDKLTKILMEVTEKVREKAVELDQQQTDLIKEYVKKGGNLKLYTLDAKQIKVLQDAVTPVHNQFSDIIPAEWIKKIKGM